MKREHVYELRTMMHKAAASLGDGDALEAVELFPAWAVGLAYAAGARVRYGARLYRVLQPHTSQPDWTPAAAPALFAEVAKPGEIPVWRRPLGAQDAYGRGDRVRYPDENGAVYESLADGNVWSPEEYPDGWERIG